MRKITSIVLTIVFLIFVQTLAVAKPPITTPTVGTPVYFQDDTGTPNKEVTVSQSNILGELSTSTRNNQIEVNFSQPNFDSDAVTNSISNSGTITQFHGAGVYSTGTSNTSSASGESAQHLLYRPASESYVYFSAAFTTPTDSVNSN